MKVTHVDILVEELSMGEFLRALLPKLVGSMSWDIHEHRSKQHLLSRLPSRLRGYASWIRADRRVVVVVDRDNDDCTELKQRLEAIAAEAGLPTRATCGGGNFIVVNRLAIEELEAWYFGDWKAVRQAYPKVKANIPAQASYRQPDAIKGGTWEAFLRLLNEAGYYRNVLPKLEVARAVGKHMDPSRNTSPSFCALRDVLLEIAAA